MLALVGVYLFKGQLIIPVCVVIVNVFSPIVNGKEGDEINVLVSVLVFQEMSEQHGKFGQLVKRNTINNNQE